MTLLSDARTYAGDTFGPTYAAWVALDDVTATQTLTAAARYLNVLPWQGTFVGTLTVSTDLVWPRSGVFVDGVEISSLTTPQDILDAQYEMAVLVFSDPKITTRTDQGTNIQSVGGGGAPTVAFFAPTTAAAGTALKFPYQVGQLIGKYLASPAASAEGGFGQAGACTSSFETCDGFRLIAPE